MIGDLTLEKLLCKYGIDGKKLIKNNPNVLEYGEYDEIEKILKYLVEELQIESKNIEKCPSILYVSTKNVIEENYNFLIKNSISKQKISQALSCLNSNKENLQYNFVYLKNRFGIEKLNSCLSVLSNNSNELVKICDYFKQKFGKEKLKECIGGISGIYSSYEKVRKTLDLSIWTIHPKLINLNSISKKCRRNRKNSEFGNMEEISQLINFKCFF